MAQEIHPEKIELANRVAAAEEEPDEVTRLNVTGEKRPRQPATGAAYATSVRARQSLSTAGTRVPGTLKERK